jgi:hypothetical protein
MTGHVVDRLSALLDAELTPREREAVEAHLSGCAECRRVLSKPRLVRLQTRWWWAAAAALVLAILPWRLAREHRVADSASRPPVAAPEPHSVTLPNRSEKATGAASPLPENAGGKTGADGSRRSRKPASVEERIERRGFVERDGEVAQAPAEPQEYASADAPAKKEDVPGSLGDDGFAAAPAAAPPASPPPPAEEPRHSGEREQVARGAGARTLGATEARTDRSESAGAAGGAAESKRVAPADEAAYGRLAKQPLRSASDARALRAQWHDFVLRFPESRHVRAARLAEIEAAAAAYRFGGQEEDLAQLRALGREYLGAQDAPDTERVRRLLEEATRDEER